MKKILLATLVVASIMVSLIALLAQGDIWKNEFIIKENSNSNEYKKNFEKGETQISKQDIDDEFDKITKKFNEDDNNFTDEKRKKALEYVNELEKNNIIEVKDDNNSK